MHPGSWKYQLKRLELKVYTFSDLKEMSVTLTYVVLYTLFPQPQLYFT